MSERISQQAKLVLDILSGEYCHLTADEIQTRIPGGSAATVYRVLEQLVSMGKIRKLALGDRKAVYEYARKPHLHFVCNRCGSISDIPVDLTGIATEAARCGGHEVQWSDTTAHGLCRDCVQASND